MRYSLENRINTKKSDKTSLREYAKVFFAVEGSAYIGANIGLNLSDILTNNKILLTTGTLSGDFIGGTIGQIVSYWYNNCDKFHDTKTNRFQYFRFLKDIAKLLTYDVPVTTFSYAIASQVTYQMLKHDWNNAVVAAGTTLTMMVIWHALNYFIYNLIKFDSDEKFVQISLPRIKSYIGYFINKNRN